MSSRGGHAVLFGIIFWISLWKNIFKAYNFLTNAYVIVDEKTYQN
jgi:hypothetical protein